MAFTPEDMNKEEPEFHWADYLVFGISLAISVGIGIFFAVADFLKQNNTADGALLGNRRIHWLPGGTSLLVSVLNAGFLLGGAAEFYYFGSYYAVVVIGTTICFALVGVLFIPTFHQMNVTSAYEYFDRRYNFKPLRIVVSLAFILNMVLLLGVVLYAPALAINEVTGIDMALLIAVTGGVCMVYTTLGGIKAVVWTDLIQCAIMIVGTIVLVAIATNEVGGISVVMDRVKEGNRFEFIRLDPDPRARHTFWTQTIGGSFVMMSGYAGNQLTIQRYLAIKSVRYCQLALMVACVGFLLLVTLMLFTSYAMYAYYFDCDPGLSGRITKGDQILPRFLMDTVGHLHGIPGLYIAALFAAALSTVSSALNSLAAVALEDFIRPLCKGISSTRAGWICKALVSVFGIITIGLSFAAEHMGERVVEIPPTIWGALSAPVLGAFVLGIFVPWSTGIGSLTGTVLGLVMGCWLGIGGVYKGDDGAVPLTPLGAQCMSTPPQPPEPQEVVPLQEFYDICYAWYGLICFLTTVIFGLIASALHIVVSNKTFSEVSKEADRQLMFQGICSGCRSTATYTVSDEKHEMQETIGHLNPAFNGVVDEKGKRD